MKGIKLNLLLFIVQGAAEEKVDDVQMKVLDILAFIEEKHFVQNCYIVELVVKVFILRPTKFTMSSLNHDNQLLQKCKQWGPRQKFPGKANFQRAR